MRNNIYTYIYIYIYMYLKGSSGLRGYGRALPYPAASEVGQLLLELPRATHCSGLWQLTGINTVQDEER
jgi:hypothetical protein